jgi:hypothetical protein
VYLGNYITSLAARPGQDTNQLDFCRQELAAARELEPDNARFDYLEASWLLKSAVQVHSEPAGEDENGRRLTDDTLEVRDRELLDEAMSILRRGASKPYMKRYSDAMLMEQFNAMGPPRRFVDLVRRTAVAAGVLLPDLAVYKGLARQSRLYAELLISEGKTEEALPFLQAWHPLTVQLAEDSFTLIDVLVVGAMAKDAERSVPPLLSQIGRDEEAEKARVSAAAVAEPVMAWREHQRQSRDKETQTAEQVAQARSLLYRGSVLASMLLPALGEWPDMESESYRPGRMLEYTVATEMGLSGVCLVFVALMVVGWVIGLRWRLSKSAEASPPFMLMPDARTLVRVLGFGVLLPLVLFLVATRWMSWSGHEYSVRVGLHKLLAESGLLVLALLLLPVFLTFRYAQRRCEGLGMATTPWRSRFLIWLLGAAALLLLVVWFLPPTDAGTLPGLAGVVLAVMGIVLGAGALLGFVQGLVGEQKYGPFYGTSFLTLIPVLAMAIIVIGVVAKPFLVASESRYLAQDTLMHDPVRPGFTRIENDLVEQILGEIRDAVRNRDPLSAPQGDGAMESVNE